jgi:hypothetical protein
MIAPVHTKTLYRKNKYIVKSTSQFEDYLEHAYKPTPSWSLNKYIKAYTLTIMTSAVLFYTVGPDLASVNNRLIKRNAQDIDMVICIQHLMSPMPWEN